MARNASRRLIGANDGIDAEPGVADRLDIADMSNSPCGVVTALAGLNFDLRTWIPYAFRIMDFRVAWPRLIF